MNILVIDNGTYSVKFVEGTYSRKDFKIQNVEEILLQDVINENDIETTMEEYQQGIIRDYLDNSDINYKLIYQLPNNFLTTRYLNLPVNNKKKAEMMIPFQLDEELPFAGNKIHYISNLLKNSTGNFEAIVQITQKDVFSDYHNYLRSNHTLPSNLLSELSVVQSYVSDRKLDGHFCILDIGHNSTKAYMAFHDKVLSNHSSSIAGSTIDEIIGQTYEISPDEARIYKHENSFFLTENQLANVSDDQKEFAILMRQSFTPLTNQIKRWLLGYRIKTGFSIEKIYITGGSSNIKNIENFLTEKLEIPVEHLVIQSLAGQVDRDTANSLGIPYLMGQSPKFKTPAQNLLTKDFASALTGGVKIEDTAFSFYRVAIITFIICATLAIENFVFLSGELKSRNKRITKLLKKEKEVGLTKKQSKLFRKKPKKVANLLKKKGRAIESDLKAISNSEMNNVIIPLAELSKEIRRNQNVSLVKYDADGKDVKAEFIAKSNRDLEQLKSLIKSLNFDSLDMKEDRDGSKLKVSFGAN